MHSLIGCPKSKQDQGKLAFLGYFLPMLPGNVGMGTGTGTGTTLFETRYFGTSGVLYIYILYYIIVISQILIFSISK